MNKRISLFALLLLLSVLAAVPGLKNRLAVERTHNTAGMVLEIQDIVGMAYESGKAFPQVISELREKGLSAIAVNELTGEALTQGYSLCGYGTALDFVPNLSYPTASMAALMLNQELDQKIKALILEYLRNKYPKTEVLDVPGGTVVVLPFDRTLAFDAGIVPDFSGLLLAQETGLPIVYRPGSAPKVKSHDLARALDWLLDRFHGIKAIVPGGVVVAGFPDVDAVAAVLRKHSIAVADIEFSRQIGASQLERALFPMILPLHSVTKEEIISRRLSRDVLIDRFVRAARERSVRLLYLRPPELLSVSSLDSTAGEMERIKNRLQNLGISIDWPSTYPLIKTGLFSYFALALVVYALSWQLLLWFFAIEGTTVSGRAALLIIILALISALPLSKVGLLLRVYGAIAAAFGAFAGAYLALEEGDRPVTRILRGFFVSVAVGLVIASVFGNTWYMLRMSAFSGVKLTLLVPPVLLLLLDLRRRIHPESLKEVMSRPPLWGEIVLFALLVVAAGVMLIRSGNVSLVPGWEKATRDLLEKVLIARPRTKELLVGYPCLAIWYYTVRCNLWPRYREIFRLGAVLAFASMINTFCHFHTHLSFTLLRVFNGLWGGLLIGILAIVAIRFLLLPLWKRWGSLLVE
ncbi:hypothetical protein Tlie_1375 [Thermovirga lienii DSM 17291]|uniref:Uncharacterized protein n=1 Tax=Thermovirga lienii (strain ATCC BAA-1197 / DSM 17291 / Cas60314) TaxID=580340 RepID=G7V6J1_THELD|nr:DUF5693 family protein [Thermovirga lienii]AER67104.1 hypothetical protein Tlie_1375 [Thermovirga lienii DSM 17291]KUK42710.1 MAG: Uncharacterized protein XD70_0475 [Thermovirga lienii]MDN5318767.1 hypothetical protein [Thermovirga sp.]MDN5367818.1 hypothetical protein [Thermovirga sp.]